MAAMPSEARGLSEQPSLKCHVFGSSSMRRLKAKSMYPVAVEWRAVILRPMTAFRPKRTVDEVRRNLATGRQVSPTAVRSRARADVPALRRERTCLPSRLPSSSQSTKRPRRPARAVVRVSLWGCVSEDGAQAEIGSGPCHIRRQASETFAYTGTTMSPALVVGQANASSSLDCCAKVPLSRPSPRKYVSRRP
jgi:hypothetical protein